MPDDEKTQNEKWAENAKEFQRKATDAVLDRIGSSHVHRARALYELTQQPGWAILQREVEEGHDSYMLAIAQRIPRILTEEKLPLALAHRKGFFDGMMALIAEPEKALEGFDQAWNREWEKLLQEEEEAVDPDWSPYAS